MDFEVRRCRGQIMCSSRGGPFWKWVPCPNLIEAAFMRVYPYLWGRTRRKDAWLGKLYRLLLLVRIVLLRIKVTASYDDVDSACRSFHVVARSFHMRGPRWCPGTAILRSCDNDFQVEWSNFDCFVSIDRKILIVRHSSGFNRINVSLMFDFFPIARLHEANRSAS